ncbi:SacI homology domain-containing protein [Glomus cerebriforme]|uniref:SacI homology domain-containing protein n=1 Tax=Glomus cerebriforme TaxID=658196 RepID=A0A397SWZ5_9GLOM|nr:SacI homology domain-containing protein [Glomus cerebriforme]
MVHESLRLYATNDSYTLVPYYLDPTIAAQTLVINRVSGECYLDGAIPDPTAHAESLTIYGVFGIINLLAGGYLIVITGRERIGRLGKHDIFQANQFRILPFAKNNNFLSEVQAQDEQRYLSLIESLLKSGSYYFSYTYDLTHTLQRQTQLTTKPLWQRADDRFFWNRYLHSKLIEITISNPDQDLSDFILPVMFGFVSIVFTKIKNRDMVFSLISRRSRYRAGTRYFSRGIDAEGNVSNFNETEQIVLLDPIEDGNASTSFEGKIKMSYVQTRGSIPIYWAQVINVKYTPKLQIMEFPNTLEAFRRHFDEQIRIYGDQILVNLVNKKGYESPMGEAYERAVKQLNDLRMRYYHFDFHHECSKMRWNRIQILIDTIEEELIQQGYFYADDSRHVKFQKSVIRANCMDCLDRTNVVQSNFAKWMLTQQLREAGVLSNKERIDEIESFMNIFRNVWADNADAVSFPYSGTGAQKTDFTRTGSRTKKGAVVDLQNGLTRYVMNNYMDGARQDAYDLLLGNYVVKYGVASPWIDTRSMQMKLAPQVLLACSVFLILLFIFSGGYNYYIQFAMFIDLIIIVFLLRFIFENGGEFVDWPRLVPRDYRFYQAKSSTSSYKQKTGRINDSEYGEKIELQKFE